MPDLINPEGVYVEIGAEPSLGFAGSQGIMGYSGSRGRAGYGGSKGFTGSRGFLGSRGPGGFTGSHGFTGSRGPQGSVGADGFIGSRGARGFFGSQGYTGSRGVVGLSGSRGFKGYTGSVGSVGSVGAKGYAGSRGYGGSRGWIGSAGFVGSKGDPGARGYSGSRGTTGFVGSQGLRGFTGSQGNTGFTGSKGDSGYAGSRGALGFTGSKGDAGYTGSKSFTGSRGPTGFAGSKGLDGGLGFTGSRGADGTSVHIIGVLGNIGELPPTGNTVGDSYIIGLNMWVWVAELQWVNVGAIRGPQGYTGSVGPVGSVGFVGSSGALGSRGFTGSQGDAGFAGSRGPTGFGGSAGTLGFTGSSGSAGGTGFVGSQGLRGWSGSRGLIGYSGSKGFVGSKGDLGFTGSRGPTGFTGSQGIRGWSGSQGIRGFTGSQGNIGFSGSAGPSGFAGSAGGLGYTGSTGPRGFTGSKGFTGSSGLASFFRFSGDKFQTKLGSSGAWVDLVSRSELSSFLLSLAANNSLTNSDGLYINALDKTLRVLASVSGYDGNGAAGTMSLGNVGEVANTVLYTNPNGTPGNLTGDGLAAWASASIADYFYANFGAKDLDRVFGYANTLPGYMDLQNTTEVANTLLYTNPNGSPGNLSGQGLAAWAGADIQNYFFLNSSSKWREPVVTVDLINQTMTTAYVIGSVVNGYTLAANDRFLLTNSGANSGIYTPNASGAPTRALDSNDASEIAGAAVYVTGGLYRGRQYKCNQSLPIVVGTTSLSYSEVNPSTMSRGADVAAASTVTLGSGSYFHITGTGGPIGDIDFTDDFIGRTAIIYFEGAVTVTEGSFLKTPNGETFTTTAGDMALVVSEGSDLIRMAFLKKARDVLSLGNVSGSFAIPIKSYHTAVTLTLTANATINAVSGTIDGGTCGTIELFVKQDATGGRTLSESAAELTTWGSDALTLVSTANTTSLLLIQGKPDGSFAIMNTGRSF